MSTADLRRLVHTLDATGQFPVPAGELSIALLDDAAMRKLHADFLNDASATDVITFEGDQDLGSAGEVCVCAEVAHEYAAAHGRDLAAELSLYVVHGYLHLAGFDDKKRSLRRCMRAAEKTALTILTNARALPRCGWNPPARARVPRPTPARHP